MGLRVGEGAAEAGGVFDVLADREFGEEAEALREEGELGPGQLSGGGGSSLASVGLLEAGEDREQSGFARAGAAEQRGELAAAELEAGVGERVDLLGAAAVVLAEPAGGENGRAVRRSWRATSLGGRRRCRR